MKPTPLTPEEIKQLDRLNILLKVWGLGQIKQHTDGRFIYEQKGSRVSRTEIYDDLADSEFWTFHNIRTLQP